MMRVVLIVLLAFLAQPLWAQSNKDKEKDKEKKNSNVEVIDFDTKDENTKNTKTAKAAPASKNTKAAPAKPTPRPSYSQRGRKPEPVTIVNFYHELPLNYLPPVKDYLKKANSSGSTYKRKDNKEFREEFIRQKLTDKNFLQIQMPGEIALSRIKMYMPEDGKGKSIIAVETSECEAACENEIHFYRKDTGQWKDVTNEYILEIDRKDVLKRLEAKYKSHYMDLEIFKKRAYDNPENLDAAITYTILPEEDKIIIKEQYMPMPLYEMVWDPKKSKFTLKKI